MDDDGQSVSQGVVLPALDARKLRGLILDECSTIGPRSARTHRDDYGHQYPGVVRNRQEEICRGMYKRQAHAFFEELKDTFGKELSGIRKQAQKSMTRVTLMLDDSDEAVTKARQLEKQIQELQQSVEQLQAAAAQQSDSQRFATRPGRSLRPAEQQESEGSPPKAPSPSKASASPTPDSSPASQKVLSMHLADLRSVCAEEFSKASGQLSENVKKWALEVCAAEIAPRQHELRAEIDVARAGFAGQVRDLMHRLSDIGMAQNLVGQRVDALEDQHHQDSWKVEQLSEEVNMILKVETSELKDKLSTLETRYGGFEHRLDSIETLIDTTLTKMRKSVDDLETALQCEVETRRKECSHTSSEIVMLDARSAAHRDCQATHAQLIQQLELSQQHSEDAERRLWCLQGRRDSDTQDRISQLVIAVQNVQAECANHRVWLRTLGGNPITSAISAMEAGVDDTGNVPGFTAIPSLPPLPQSLRMALEDPFSHTCSSEKSPTMKCSSSSLDSMVHSEDAIFAATGSTSAEEV